MSGTTDLDSTLESIISHSVASKASVAEEALRNKGMELMARTMQRLLSEPSAADFGTRFVKELEHLVALMEDEDEVIYKGFKLEEKEGEQQKVATLGEEDTGMNNDSDLPSKLNRITIDLTEERLKATNPRDLISISSITRLGI
ncbi:hypothetical protein RRF57_010538 [Xylaria bambusicola]|uniref:Uncharacterized protein n=1 Tax=Xylaria bambusicola TaxID=326684 RepID=A0AAN7ULD5_9PEZI